MTSPTTSDGGYSVPQADEPAVPHPVLDAVGTGAGLAVAGKLAAGGVDPFLPWRWRHVARLAAVERRLHAAYTATLGRWLDGARRRVLAGGVVDPSATYAIAGQFSQQIRREVEVVVEEIFHDAFTHEAGEDAWPDGERRARDWIEHSTNRLVGVPNDVYTLIQDATKDASSYGWSMQELAAKVGTILDASGNNGWANRGMVVARTEAIGAYNAGTYAGMLSYAGQMGGDWEKVWLATDDTRTRPTHREADGQRVPLAATFTVGGYPALYPHDPMLPPGETIQCRCVPLLVRPGETVPMTNRQYKGGRDA